MELTNICPDVKAQIYKLASINLCSNVDGQIMVCVCACKRTLTHPLTYQYLQ